MILNPRPGVKLMASEKKVILVIGKRGSGKSYLVKKMIAESQRLFVYDVMAEYNKGVVFGPQSWAAMAALWRKSYRGNFRLIYRPIEDQKEMQTIAHLIFALGNLTFVVEEIDTVAQAYRIPWMFRYILRRGRHRDITLIGVTPSPYGIHRDLTRQAKEIYLFSTNEPRDKQYLSGLLGSEMINKLEGLEEYQYVKWDEGSGLSIGRA